MRGLQQVIREVERKLNSLVSLIEGRKLFHIWRGRRVIESDEWLKLYRKDADKALAHFPDDYVAPYFVNNEGWEKDFMDLMVESKNEKYGKTLCGKCILNPDAYDVQGIRNMVRHVFDGCKGVEYPCKIINKFKCPYLEKNADGIDYDFLISIGIIADAIEKAVSHAQYLTYKNGYVYEVDFEKGRLNQYSKYGSVSSCGSYDDRDLDQYSVVPIDSYDLQDVFKAISNTDLLAKILDQSFSDDPNERNELIKEYALALINEIRDRISVSDLRDPAGRTLEEIARTKKYLEENCKPLKKGLCKYCNMEANIRDTNCNIWLCVNHWKTHRNSEHARYK